MRTRRRVSEDWLRDRRRSLLRHVQTLSTDSAELVREPPPDWEDLAQAQSEQARLASLSDAERREIFAIDRALERIRQGTFGRCVSCDKPIGADRMRAVPEAERCITCEISVQPHR